MNENGRQLLATLLDDWRLDRYINGGVTPTQQVAIDEAEAILATDADVARTRADIAARLDRAADHNDGGFKRVLRMLANRVREGRENSDL